MSAILPKPMLAAIARGEPLAAETLPGPFGAAAVAQRARANAEMAEALFAAGRAREAADCAERALLLSSHSDKFLPLYVDIQKALGHAERVRSACRRAGIRLAEAGRTVEAVALFNQSHYAYESAGLGDRYEFDFEIMRTIDQLAARCPLPEAAAPALDGRLRLAYLVFGAAHQGSVLVKLLCQFARHHDAEKFDVRFFVAESPLALRHAPYAECLHANIAQLEAHGARVERTAARDELECWVGTARSIREFGADVLVTTALLADYSHYFIAAARPAPTVIGLGLGPPAQYAAPGLDWVICATRHPAMDMPCDASVVEFESALPDRSALRTAQRSPLGVPEHAPLLLVAGRAQKFLDRSYWAALARILLENPQAWLLVLGTAEVPPFLNEVMPPQAQARFRQVGWSGNYLEMLAMADLVLDTYPSGGGFTLTDAMSFGIPVAGMRNDYLRPFDQAQWMPAEEIIGIDDLIAPRGDFDALCRIAGRLIAEPEYRRNAGARCRAEVLARRGDPRRMVARHEEIYARVAAANAGAPAPIGLARARDSAQSALEGRADWGRPRVTLLRRALRRAKRLLTG